MQNDDEDTECYFLQPVSSPYDLSQKVKEANKDLNRETIDFGSKESRIKFKDNLVDYEPEFSYEEASSIESEDNIDDYILEDDHVALEKRLESSLILKSFETTENDNESNINNERDEDINDEISEDLETNILNDPTESFNLNLEYTTAHPNKIMESLLTSGSSHINSKEQLNVKQSKPAGFRKSTYIENIICNQHCIEKIDCSNCKDAMVKLPRLKLHRRKCCEKNKTKIQQKLPCYTGLRSEYGLTTLQLQRRDNIKEIVLLKGKERKRRTEENKLNKSIENELIFCNWLKSVSIRKLNDNYLKQFLKPLTYGIIKSPVKVNLKSKQRPNNNTTRSSKIRIKKKISNTSQSQILMCDISVEIPRA